MEHYPDNHFNYIKKIIVKDVNAIKECRLNDLSRLNVICGKNNSGKSTLLTGINNPSNRYSGGILTSDMEAELIGICLAEWNIPSHHNTRINQIKNIINNYCKSNKEWFHNEGQEFIKSFNSFTHEKYDKHITANTLKEFFNKNFNNDYTTLLIPPKRNIEINRSIQSNQEINPDGSGLLNYLFTAKNMNEASSKTKIFNKIKSAFYKITSGYSFEVYIGTNNDITLYFSRDNQQWINAKDCGLGLQDLLVMLYFSIEDSFNIILIEEPESHLHPDMQRKLLNYLKHETKKQFFLSTHSNIFLDMLYVDRVFYTSYSESICVNDETNKASILDELGYAITDNLVSDLIILVEGPTDKPILEVFLQKKGLFNRFDIKIWPLGGDNMGKVDLSIFKINQPIIALIDADPKSSKIRNRFIINCEKQGIPFTQLKRYSIENYFTVEALREVFGGQIPDTFQFVDPDIKLFDQISIDVKQNNRKLSEAMKIDDIKSTDFYEFLLKIEEICVNLPSKRET